MGNGGISSFDPSPDPPASARLIEGIVSLFNAKSPQHVFARRDRKPHVVRLEGPLPPRIDLRYGACFPYPTVADQRKEGSCISHALSAAYECVQRKERVSALEAIRPSPFHNYAAARVNMPRQSRKEHAEGTTFEAALEAMEKGNVPSGREADASVDSKRHAVSRARRLQVDPDNLKRCLALGFPCAVGFAVNAGMRAWQESQQRIRESRFVMPRFAPGDDVVGAHAVTLMGYDDELEGGVFLARNSWGERWGMSGHFFIPYDNAREATQCVRDAFFIESTVAAGNG